MCGIGDWLEKILCTLTTGQTTVGISSIRTSIKGVGWLNISILSSVSKLNPRPFRNLQKESNVWHQYHPYSRIIGVGIWQGAVRRWRRQSHPDSWREVSLSSFQWRVNCVYVLCISLCWTFNTLSASPLLQHKGVVISFPNANTRQLYRDWPRLVVDSGRY